MSLAKILGTAYEPTAAFSFEFFRRDPSNRSNWFPNHLGEIFFLLPPEEYSLTEGYRVNITKTASGGWIDDFGNDFKQLRLTGSLYSYYSGYPVTKPNVAAGALSGPKDFAKKVGSKVLQQGKRLVESVANEFGVSIPGLKGLSGLEEFFKLRWMLSRFRDEITGESGEKSKVSPPESLENETIIGIADEPLFDSIMLVYHDYDDNNHFEVILNNFTMRRSKSDPFTINYVIEMTCVRTYNSIYLGEGKIMTKENPSAIISEFKDTFNDVLDTLSAIANIPNSIMDIYDDLISAGESLKLDLERFESNVTSNWNKFVSRINGVQEKASEMEELLYTTTSGLEIDELSSEDEQLPEDYLNIQSGLDDLQLALANLNGIELYYSADENESTFNIEETILENTDFESDAEEKQGNIFTRKNQVYYIVIQGDTLPNLGYKFYGDYEKASIIAKANGLTHFSFENDEMVGVTIVIPLESRKPSKLLDNNLVYYRKLKQATPRERQLQLLGNDFRLNEDREIVVDGSGDFSLVYGEECYKANIDDRLSFSRGILNPIHPSWGIDSNIGDAPSTIVLTKAIDNIEGQVLSDPRTQKAFIDRNNIELNGDVTKIILHYKPFSGSESILNAAEVVAGFLT